MMTLSQAILAAVMVAATVQYAVAESVASKISPELCLQSVLDNGPGILLGEGKACAPLLLSKLLGWGIVVGASIVKLPQLINILRLGTAAGISRSSLYIELLCNSWTTAYNVAAGHPFSTWGEAGLIAVQNVALVGATWAYAPANAKPVTDDAVGLAVALTAAGVLPLGLAPEARPILATATTVLFTAARLPQIISNIRAGHTGSLSMITLFMNFAGTLARVFTTITEVSDPLVFANYMLSATLNGILVLQGIIYWKATNQYLDNLRKQKTQ